MKEHSEPSKEETKLQSEQKPQLRSAEEILENHYWRVYGQSHDTYVTNYRINSATHHTVLIGAMKEYASQFKSQLPIEQKNELELIIAEKNIDIIHLRDRIKELESQPLPIEGVEREWISVEERLPQESGRYWCYVVHFGELGRSSEQVNCSYSERHGFTEKLNPMNVTHWMPLPKRPQI